ncbi:MAG: rhomboid family intramembrane serine protease [Opitutaceae bacterium]|nr:rhomboid family intramembrane serine protease [Opitutaceae bacterium]
MLSDRPYMRDDHGGYRAPGTSMLTWIIVAIIAGFILQNIFLRWFNAGSLFHYNLALTAEGFQAGKVWTLLTYSLLHSTSNLLHIIGNLLAIYFLGRELIGLLGERRFLGFCLTAVAVGGLAWTAVHWNGGGILLGASAATCGLLAVFACFFPNRQITFLLFFILPVTVKPKYLAWAVLGLDACGFVFYEIMGAVSPFGIAHSAHLGGMLTGWIYHRYIHDSHWSLPWQRTEMTLPRWARKAKVSTNPAPRYTVNLENAADLRAEVDRILDKINSEGFGALTAEEKRVLDGARDQLSRR